MSKSQWQKVTVDEASARFREDPVSMLKEYERMRDIERKRMNRLQESDYAWTKTAKRERSLPVSQMDIRDFSKAYSDLSKFLSAKTSTLGGQRSAERKTTKTLNKAIGADTDEEEDEESSGETDSKSKVTHENYKRVIQILDEARKMKIMYDSNKIVELADSTLALSDDAFEAVLDNLDEAIKQRHSFTEMTDLQGYSFDDIVDKLSK